VCGGGGDECISTSPSDWAEIVVQTIVEDPLMRHSAILVFANKQDLVMTPPPLPPTPGATFLCTAILQCCSLKEVEEDLHIFLHTAS